MWVALYQGREDGKSRTGVFAPHDAVGWPGQRLKQLGPPSAKIIFPRVGIFRIRFT